MANQYEEYRVFSNFWAWVVIIGISFSLVAWGMLVHHTVPEVERKWDVKQLPSIPGESIYSTAEKPEKQDVQQIEPLPPIMLMRPYRQAETEPYQEEAQ